MSPHRSTKLRAAIPVVDTSGCDFNREQHAYLIDGAQVPSVTQVLEEERFVDFSMVPRDRLDEAQRRGTHVHAALHYHLDGDFDREDLAEPYRGYFDSALAFLETAQLTSLRHPTTGATIGVEYRAWDKVRRFAGTADYIAWDADGVLSINDFKTGEPSDVAAPLQLAAYEYLVRLTLFPNHRFPIRRRALKLFRDGKPARVELYGPENGHPYAQDSGTFFAALNCVHYRRNEMAHYAT